MICNDTSRKLFSAIESSLVVYRDADPCTPSVVVQCHMYILATIMIIAHGCASFPASPFALSKTPQTLLGLSH
jgi:hypothetical protein